MVDHHAAQLSAKSFRHRVTVDSGDQVLGRERGHLRARVDGGRADVRQKNTIWKPKNISGLVSFFLFLIQFSKMQ